MIGKINICRESCHGWCCAILWTIHSSGVPCPRSWIQHYIVRANIQAVRRTCQFNQELYRCAVLGTSMIQDTSSCMEANTLRKNRTWGNLDHLHRKTGLSLIRKLYRAVHGLIALPSTRSASKLNFRQRSIIRIHSIRYFKGHKQLFYNSWL